MIAPVRSCCRVYALPEVAKDVLAIHNVQVDGSVLVSAQNESLCDTNSANELLERLQELGMNNLHVRLSLSLDECKVTDWSFLQAPRLASLRISHCRGKSSLFLFAESLPPRLECLTTKALQFESIGDHPLQTARLQYDTTRKSYPTFAFG